MSSKSKKSSPEPVETPPPETTDATEMLDSAALPDTEKTQKTRRVYAAASPIEIDPAFLSDQPRMQYALLLALLLRMNGSVKLSAKELEPDDRQYNIVFARTMDGKRLEVTVVNSTSGILKSPARSEEKPEGVPLGWAPMPDEYRTGPPDPIQFAAQHAHELAAKLQAEHVAQFGLPAHVIPMKPAQMGPGALANAGLAAELAPAPEANAINSSTNVTQPRDGSQPYQFPFEVGANPATARPVDLSAAAALLLQKDRQIASEEAAAIDRQETGQ